MVLALSLFVFILAIYITIFNFKINSTAYFLGGFFLIFASYSITHHFIVNTNSVFWIAIFYNHLSPFWLLPGPLMFFYVKGTVTDKSPLANKWEYLHFLPAIIQFIGIIPYCLKPFSEKKEIAQHIISNINNIKYIDANWIYPKSHIGYLIRPAITTIYAVYSGIYLIYHRSFKKENKKLGFQQNVMTYYWLVFFITITILIGASVFVTLYYLTFTNKPGEIMDTLPSHLLSGMASFLLIICLLAFPNILYGMPKFGAQNIKEKTGGTNDPLLELGENIIKYIHSEQRYLDNNFHIKDLSIALNVPQHHVLYCFNHLIKQSFNEYCTQCRIHWAKELIDKGIITSLTIEAIGVKLGFPSRSKFYLAFEKETGYTPNQ